MAFLHGIETKYVDDGKRAIEVKSSSVIGLVGTATDNTIEDSKYPYNKPFIINSVNKASELGVGGTLPPALDAIFDQIKATIIVVRVQKGADEDENLANLIGGADSDNKTGIQALLNAQSITGLRPKIISIPEFTHEQALLTEAISVTEKIKAVVIADCDAQGTIAEAITYRNLFGSERLFLHYPAHRYFDVHSASEKVRSSAPAIAGLIAKTDIQVGFWASPSNKELNGVLGSSAPVSFAMGDTSSDANLLNENAVATTINNQGLRLWGNRTTSNDGKTKFLNVVRTRDVIADSIEYAFNYAVDNNITKGFVDGIVESTKAFLSNLQAQGAILGGDAWFDAELNTPEQIENGHITISYEFTPSYPAERITFNSTLTNKYVSNLF